MNTFKPKSGTIGPTCIHCGKIEAEHFGGAQLLCEAIQVEEGRETEGEIHAIPPEEFQRMDLDDDSLNIRENFQVAIQIAELLPEGDEVRTKLLHGAAAIWHLMNTHTMSVSAQEVEA